MIGKLRGSVALIRGGFVILDVNGVGYKVYMTEVSLGKIAEMSEAEIFVHTHVREDNLSLFGFLNLEEFEIFELLISISGIGPKAGLGILTIASPDAIKTAVYNEDPSILTKVSGVGKKTAGRIILELKNKISMLPETAQKEATTDQDVIEALISMGYSVSEARHALSLIPKGIKDTSEKMKLALKAMRK